MADMLNVAVSGLRAFQRALETTSHNIANVSTPGYSRQRAEFQTRTAAGRPDAGWVGTGVETATQVRRVYDQFLAQQARSSSGTSLARLDAFASQAERASTTCSATPPTGSVDLAPEVTPTPSTKFPRTPSLHSRPARC